MDKTIPNTRLLSRAIFIQQPTSGHRHGTRKETSRGRGAQNGAVENLPTLKFPIKKIPSCTSLKSSSERKYAVADLETEGVLKVGRPYFSVMNHSKRSKRRYFRHDPSWMRPEKWRYLISKFLFHFSHTGFKNDVKGSRINLRDREHYPRKRPVFT